MSNGSRKLLLVGDNPFHGISHLSQERARSRNEGVFFPVDKAADVVATSLRYGADGFMFSVSDTTLGILKTIKERRNDSQLELYAIVPYAFEYVRVATQTGTPGLARRFVKQIAVSGDIATFGQGLKAVLKMDPEGLVKTYLAYEISRIKSSAGKQANLASILLHEVITDMSLALGFDWLFHSYVTYLSKREITPGFHTRNFPYLVKRFEEWNIDLDKTVITTPFNKAGFQMNPSREECEKTLSSLSSPIVMAISVLASGYFKPSTAVDHVIGLTNLKGVVAGVSSEQQARETFTLFRERLNKKGLAHSN
jgi:hypothetical protein